APGRRAGGRAPGEPRAGTTARPAPGVMPMRARTARPCRALSSPPCRASCPRVVLQEGEEIVILPGAVDLEIAACRAFTREAGLLQHALGGVVVRQACRLQPVQAKGSKGEGQAGLDRVGHVAVADVWRPDPIA